MAQRTTSNFSSGDEVTWFEISGPLSDLNRATRNQVTAVWAACKGICAIRSMVGGIKHAHVYAPK